MAGTSITASHRAINYALRLHDDLRRGVPCDFDREQAALTNIVLDIPETDEQSPDRGVRYAVVCWLDERFTCDSPWSAAWNEQKLESALYGSNDRAWEFWRQARLAESRPTDDALSVYFLCVALGFRGEMRAQPERLAAWVEKTRARVARLPARGDGSRVRLTRRQRGAALHGGNRLRRLAAVACLVGLVAAPVASYAVMQRLLG